ncbi:glycosyltransferase family 2 protein [Nitrincola sp. MINF-07-Sa-05]|uniref:glycosyltransferase family 2 protein n=1 Tax=Nitrincola salilacus TaxID=3400273 RepID=UPI003917EC20
MNNNKIDLEEENRKPLVSIGMPVYNESRFIQSSLDSILSQSYKNIEIIISDNFSTDSTFQICSDYSKNNKKIKLHRFDKNNGAAANFEYVLKNSTGKYFMWASGHDLWKNNLIEKYVEQLELNQTASLAIASNNWISETGHRLKIKTSHYDTRGLDPVARYFTVFWGSMNPILGIIRRENISSKSITKIVGSDLVFLTSLALNGDFIHVKNTEWNRREFRREKNYEEKLKRYKSESFGLATSLTSKAFPLAQLPYALISNTLRSNTPIKIKISILFLLIFTMPIKYFCGKYLSKTPNHDAE